MTSLRALMTCASCGGASPVRRCVCGGAAYCDAACQRRHWRAHKPTCPPFMISALPGRGQGVVAARRLRQGQCVVVDSPLLVVPGHDNGRGGMKTDLAAFEREMRALSPTPRAQVLSLHDPAANIGAPHTGGRLEKVTPCSDMPETKERFETDTRSTVKIETSLNSGASANSVVCWDTDLPSEIALQLGDMAAHQSNSLNTHNAAASVGTDDHTSGDGLSHSDEHQEQATDEVAGALEVTDAVLEKALRIFECNSIISACLEDAALYPVICRINHSCAPNVLWMVSPDAPLRRRVITLCDVNKGAELCVSYRGRHDYAPRDERRDVLRRCWRFDCACVICSLMGEELEENEERRREIQALQMSISQQKLGARTAPQTMSPGDLLELVEMSKKKLDRLLEAGTEFVADLPPALLDCWEFSSYLQTLGLTVKRQARNGENVGGFREGEGHNGGKEGPHGKDRCLVRNSGGVGSVIGDLVREIGRFGVQTSAEIYREQAHKLVDIFGDGTMQMYEDRVHIVLTVIRDLK